MIIFAQFRNIVSRSRHFCLGLVVILCLSVVGCGPSENTQESSNNTNNSNEKETILSEGITSQTIASAPGIGDENRQYVGPLADAYERIDPTKDGWETEAFSQSATKQLKKLAKSLEKYASVSKGEIAQIFLGDAKFSLQPEELTEVFNDEIFAVKRGDMESLKDPSDPIAAFVSLLKPISLSGHIQTEVKLYKVEPLKERVKTRVIFHATGQSENGRQQINCKWDCFWIPDTSKPYIENITLLSYEVATRLESGDKPLFGDVTASVLGDQPSYKSQLLQSTDHWRSRIPRIIGLDVVANHGLAIGDVNGDGLEDLYLCQQGGLPNRLYLQQPDGSMEDYTHESGTGWIDYCASALIIDLDNDGDRDLAISQDFQLLLMKNDGKGHFSMAANPIRLNAQTFSLSAADYDTDGDLDIFACGYNPSNDRQKTGSLGEPIPYHDAQNGGKNTLWQNQNNWSFLEVTDQVGLNQNNNRFSFAASWIDYDNDEDLDLYVANDYGRNNLYQFENGKFKDVAGPLGVEDMSAGMSTSWSDFNRDGGLDLYVSNMFSAAGNRITFQRQFKPGIDNNLKTAYQRHARGNSLFQGSPDGSSFTDVSEEFGVSMGRWAWGSRFADLNNDGWDDILVANGFITTEDTGDL